MALTTFDPTQLSSNTFLGIGKNRIINGEMNIDQVKAGTSLTVNAAANLYSVDQFLGFGTGSAGVFTLQRDATTPPTGFANSLKATCTTADASIGSTDTYFIQTSLEGYNVRDFLFGLASAKTITLSFWVRSSLTGIYTGSFQNSALNRAYPFEYTINVADTWEQKIVTFSGDITGTWLTTSGIGLTITWCLAIGSTFQGTANTWTGAQRYGTANQVNFMSSNTSRTWAMTGVQLEIGAGATPFEYRPFALEVALCQRYFTKSTPLETVSPNGGSNNMIAALVGATEAWGIHQKFPIHMRASPTFTVYNAANTAGSLTWYTSGGVATSRVSSGQSITADHWSVTHNTGAGSEILATGDWIADARL